jgi:Na+/pantothenate symporter
MEIRVSDELRWPSIAMSTIATNIQAGHFIGMGGAAYAYGLAQANFSNCSAGFKLPIDFLKNYI